MQLINSESRKYTRWTSALSVAALSGFALILTLGSLVSAHALSQNGSTASTPGAAATHAAETVNDPEEPLAMAKGPEAHVSSKLPGTYKHQWKSADGDNVEILNKSSEPPSPEERQHIEKMIREKFALDTLPK